MQVDIDAVWFAGLTTLVIGHGIAYFIQQGESKQWKKDVDEKLKDMDTSIQKIQDIHTLEKLNSQKISQLVDGFNEHKKSTERQFTLLTEEVKSSSKEVLNAIIQLVKK